MEEKLRRFNDQLLNGMYQHFEGKIEKERFRDKYIERSMRSCNFPMDIRIKEIVG